MSNNPPAIVAPSLLAGDHGYLRRDLQSLKAADTPWVHLDIMDGNFVPNISFGPQTVADLRPHSELFFDTHLMLARPDLYVDAFIKAGANLISIHLEPAYDVSQTLANIRQQGLQAGLALNPDTPIERARPFLSEIDLLLVMTVQPGFGGQKFRRDMLQKIATAAEWRQECGLEFRIEVDGGVGIETGLECRRAGADTLVCGTSFFAASDRTAFCRELTAADPGA